MYACVWTGVIVICVAQLSSKGGTACMACLQGSAGGHGNCMDLPVVLVPVGDVTWLANKLHQASLLLGALAPIPMTCARLAVAVVVM